MLLAYIDEVGEPGAYVSRSDARYSTSPAFGYAGFIVPSGRAREFAAHFAREKAAAFRAEIAKAEHPGRWERKGASIFRPTTPDTYPQYLRVFDSLVRHVQEAGGHLFYHADEKPLGTPRQTELDPSQREAQAMQEALNRIARHADRSDSNVLIMIDQINEKDRAKRLPTMYSHILGRASDFNEMRRIIEPPMHIDSQLSSNIQFADWIAACVGRAIDYQLVAESPYGWVCDRSKLKSVRGVFTHESKLHLWSRTVDDLHHSEIFRPERPVHPSPQGHLLGSSVHANAMLKIKLAAERVNRK